MAITKVEAGGEPFSGYLPKAQGFPGDFVRQIQWNVVTEMWMGRSEQVME
jgi:hypothetical protein